MNKDRKIYLPGTDKQFRHLKNQAQWDGSDVLIIGSNSENIAEMFLDTGAKSVIIILDDYDSLLKARYLLKSRKHISVRLMDFSNTDFKDAAFDIIYAQASISNPLRNKILREIKRIIKKDGLLSVGEIVSLKESVPKFVNDIWDSGNMLPLSSDKLTEYYEGRNFEVVSVLDLSLYLRDFYLESKKLLANKMDSLSENEKSYYKKLLKRISHESNAYLKLDGKDYMGFTSIIVRKRT